MSPSPPQPHDDADHPAEAHGFSIKAYGWVLAALMVLLAATAGAHALPLGPFGLVVSMAIAAAKAALVVVVFMHLRFEGAVLRLFAVAGLFWLAILIALTLCDFLTRVPM